MRLVWDYTTTSVKLLNQLTYAMVEIFTLNYISDLIDNFNAPNHRLPKIHSIYRQGMECSKININ